MTRRRQIVVLEIDWDDHTSDEPRLWSWNLGMPDFDPAHHRGGVHARPIAFGEITQLIEAEIVEDGERVLGSAS
ncbi:MAG: hypothetical protein AAGA99_26510 [Actinomycetota bacterium]